jgi:hypothetical protein
MYGIIPESEMTNRALTTNSHIPPSSKKEFSYNPCPPLGLIADLSNDLVIWISCSLFYWQSMGLEVKSSEHQYKNDVDSNN